ncbi:HD domain-containing protein [bacterium]|nr:HD domain-containing protein [bacterium]
MDAYAIYTSPISILIALSCLALVLFVFFKGSKLGLHLSRSLVYSFISIFITANFIISILAFERVLRLFLGYETFLPTILFALLAGVVLHPLRQAAQVFTDRVFFKEEYSAHKTLRKFTKEIISIIDLDELLSSIISTIKNVMRLEQTYIMLHEEPEGIFVSRGLGKKITLLKDSPLIEHIAKTGEKVLKTETEEKKFSRKSREDFTMLGAELVLPMICKNKLLGLLVLGRRRSRVPYSKKDLAVLETLCDGAAITIENAGLYEKSRLHLLGTIKALAATIEAKDPLTIGHCEKVAVYSAAMAKELGFQEEKIDTIRMGAYLHDIGKIGIAEKILFKPGRLTGEEFSLITQHPLIGLRIIEPVKPPREVTDIIKYHHERVDGKGYPEGLKGENIPLSAKIVACADSFEVMTTGRIYKRGMSLKDAIFELRKCSGTQFDPEVVGVFIKLLQEKDIFLGEKAEG